MWQVMRMSTDPTGNASNASNVSNTSDTSSIPNTFNTFNTFNTIDKFNAFSAIDIINPINPTNPTNPTNPINPNNPTTVKERKISQSASCKIDSIIRQLFLPMLNMPTPERTSFLAEDCEDQLLRQVARDHPSVLATESEFVDYMVLLYKKFQVNLGQGFKDLNSDPSSPYSEAHQACHAVHPNAGEQPM